MTEPVVIYAGATGQPFFDQIKIDGRPLPLGTGSEIKFQVRHAISDVKKIDADGIVDDEAKGKVHYDWVDQDLDTPGEYFYWWHIVTADNEVIDTDESLLIVSLHAPGIRTRTGAIYQAARSVIPVTWDALEKSPKYGDALLQQRIESTKLKVFGTSIPVENEANFDPRVIEYIGKLAALDIIPAGADYWSDKKVSVTATGTNETSSYPNRIASLWLIYDHLFAQVNRDRDLIETILNLPTVRALTSVPKFSEGTDDSFVTPSPNINQRDYGFRHNRYGGEGRRATRRQAFSDWWWPG